MPLSHEHVGSKIQAKIRNISSPEQNYFLIFAMRYPVSYNKVENNSSNCKVKLKEQTISLVSQSTKRLFFTLIGIKPLKGLAYLEMELRTYMYSFVTEKIMS